MGQVANLQWVNPRFAPIEQSPRRLPTCPTLLSPSTPKCGQIRTMQPVADPDS